MSARRLLLAFATLAAAYAAARIAVVARVRRFEHFDADREELPGIRLYLRGRRVHLLIEGTGPPLLLIHGFAASNIAFRRLAPLLRPRYQLIAPDLPGFGFSERSVQADHSYEAMAALLVDLLDRLGIQRAAVVGHSIGAAIALRLAAAAPERVAALVLAGGPGRQDPQLPKVFRPLLTLAVPLIAESLGAQRLLNRWAMAPDGTTDEDAIAAYLLAGRVPGNAATLVSILTATHHGPRPAPASIAIPTLVLTGAADRYFPPAHARALADLLPAAEVVIVPNAAHLVLEEQPERCADAIVSFLDRACYRDGGEREGVVP